MEKIALALAIILGLIIIGAIIYALTRNYGYNDGSCPVCGYGYPSHPQVDNSNNRVYVCPHCDNVALVKSDSNEDNRSNFE